MSGRFLVIIALFAAGFIFLPQLVTLFAGQHNWYDLAVEQNILSSDIRCEKCHADVVEEMEIHTGPHTGETGYGRMECAQCHRVKLGKYQFAAIGDDFTQVIPGGYAHAAATVACMDCHRYVTKKEFDMFTVGGNHAAYKSGDNLYWFQKCEKCHGKGFGPGKKGYCGKQIPEAGGFGLTTEVEDTGIREAHMAFVNRSLNGSKLMAENEACVSCHTAVAVKINWSYATNLEFEVEYGKIVNSEWSVDEFKPSGKANITVWGNSSGDGTTDKESWTGEVVNVYT